MLFSLSELFGMFFRSCVGDISMKVVLDVLLFCRYYIFLFPSMAARNPPNVLNISTKHYSPKCSPKLLTLKTNGGNPKIKNVLKLINMHVFPMEVGGICSDLAVM